MRTALKMIGGEQRYSFYGTFARYGVKNGYKGPQKTVLLVDIKNENKEIVTTHLWFNLTKGFKKLEMQQGDVVTFKGRIKPYIKGYRGRREDVFAPIEMDYQIQYPTQIKIVKRRNIAIKKKEETSDGRDSKEILNR